VSRTALAALDDQILAVLRDAGPVPTSTPEVARLVGRPSRYDASAHIYPRLATLARRGLVVRTRFDGRRDVFWNLA
jgi:hypothetical protein